MITYCLCFAEITSTTINYNCLLQCNLCTKRLPTGPAKNSLGLGVRTIPYTGYCYNIATRNAIHIQYRDL